jgi:hypothetical protein
MNNLSAYGARLIGEYVASRHEAGGGPMRKLPRSKLLKSMLIQAGRTFLQTFLAVLLATPVLDMSGPALKAAGVAGFASVLSLVHRLLDETPVPSLVDTTAADPAAAPAPAAAPSAA